MEGFRQGAIKLINSLSRGPDVVVLEAIDPDRSILRINIDDLGWEPADWETLVESYPYGTRPDTPTHSLLEQATGTKTTFIRADWFAFAASRGRRGEAKNSDDRRVARRTNPRPSSVT